jgi:DNA integrity scanning protein DisA with diadenylate cyclase activity
MFTFSKTYFALSAILLAIEVAIGFYMRDAYIRPFGGDFLVVILIYCFVKSFIKCNVNGTLIGVLLFAYLIEILQYFHFVNLLGLQNAAAARIIIGTHFAWTDMLMYTLGILLVWISERFFRCI